LTQGKPSRATARRARSRCSARTPALSDLDLRILDLLASHRVLTQTQLASINSGTPARTLRYRCARLTREGLAGRSRPYRERGSSPHHFWPTRKGEAIVTGGPPPRGGERREPNPLFLAHAAGLSEIYVALKTALLDEVKLVRFEREADAREPFSTPVSREKRAIAPDAFVEIADVGGGSLLAFVELDMGSMSHRRLKTKAAGYAEYVKAEAWRERHRFCPALLFVTTTEKRARSFLAAMAKEAGGDSLLLTCACDLVRRLSHFASEDRWLLSVDEGKRAADLLNALRESRRPFDEEQERMESERHREDVECERLRSDPEALRLHLRSRSHRDWGSERLGRSTAAALMFTLEQDDALDRVEREALSALGSIFANPLRVQLDDRKLTADERHTFDALVRHHLARQLDRVRDLAERFGDGPALRKARQHLQGGALLDRDDLSWRLSEEAKRDGSARAEQKRLREDYLDWREQRARQLAKAQGIVNRLRNGPETFLDEVDRRALRLCGSCDEIAYPDPKSAAHERGARYDVAGRCHFCNGRKLKEIEQ
jgi:hypothetical protein